MNWIEWGAKLLDWNQDNILLIAGKVECPANPEQDRQKWRKKIEPWLSSIFQSEHLSLLLGAGFSTAVAYLAQAQSVGMDKVAFDAPHQDKVTAYAKKNAERMGRGEPNIEDQLSTALALLSGLQIVEAEAAGKWEAAIDTVLEKFLRDLLAAEKSISAGLDNRRGPEILSGREALVSFLMSFASRAASRDRLHIFTTNYDRLVERGADIAGLRIVDRFVGSLEPEFRSSRLQVDLHYMPPGVRGEPRHLEGVVHLTKLHGSLDWRYERPRLWRSAVPFGAAPGHPGIPEKPRETVMIYPNAAKDVETAAYPYADLFRDFSAALCRPNSVLVCYGYGFGDDHLNRILSDMLTIPSTHLVIIAWGEKPHERIRKFIEGAGHLSQITLLLGKHFGDLSELVGHYLPKPAIDPLTLRMTQLVERRGEARALANPEGEGEGEGGQNV